MSRAPVLHNSCHLRDWVLAAILSAIAVNACQTNDDDATEPGGARAGASDDHSTFTAAGQGSAPSAVAGTEQGGGESRQNHAGQNNGGFDSTSGGGGSGGADSEPSGGGACADDGMVGECGNCLQTHCCSEWKGCKANDECRACGECLDSQMDLGGCVVMNLCDIAPNATADILRCGLDECVTECGFD